MASEKQLKAAKKLAEKAVKDGLLTSAEAVEAVDWLSKDNGDYPEIRNGKILD
jgi:hypothetical protein